MSENDKPSLFDAISHAIDTGETGAAHEPPADPSAVDDAGADDAGPLEASDDQDAGGAAEGDDQGGEPRGEAAEGGEHEGEGGENAGLVRDPATGKFVKREAAAADKPGEKPGEKAAVKPGEKPGDKPGEKKPDHVNDPIPKDLKPQTQERMRYLVNETKRLTEEATKVKTDFDFMVNGIKATGTTPDQYGEVLSFMALFNSPDTAQKEKALELIESVADRLATMLGKERAVSDPLAAHADLKADVAANKITLQYAKEIARQRNQTKFTGELTAAQRAEQERTEAAATELENARTSLNTLEATLKKSDPQFAQIRAIVVPSLKPVFKQLPPSKWEAAFKEAYNAQKARMPKPGVRPSNPGNQPLRAGRGSGGGGNANGGDMKQQPTSMLDAVNAGLAQLGK